MDVSASVTVWLERLKSGEEEAVQPLWERYFHRMVQLARQKLKGRAGKGAADEEDAALSAFDTWCRGARAGRFPHLEDRDDLWQVLMMLTTRKAISQLRREGREKRGGGAAAPAGGHGASGDGALADALGREPTPELAAEVAETCSRLLGALADPDLRAIAVARMEGYSVAEIAARTGRSIPTIERRLRLIRQTWEAETSHEH
jgi:DNA-directed RNA polymerase specialized sigma24 family protein